MSETRRTMIKPQRRIVLELFKVNERYYRRKCPRPYLRGNVAQPLSILTNDPRASIQPQEIYNELQSLENKKELLNHLDHTITEQEIRQAVKKLKNKKSPFVDKIGNEMMKASLELLMPVYIKAFNLILQSGKMPDIWCPGLKTLSK